MTECSGPVRANLLFGATPSVLEKAPLIMDQAESVVQNSPDNIIESNVNRRLFLRRILAIISSDEMLLVFLMCTQHQRLNQVRMAHCDLWSHLDLTQSTADEEACIDSVRSAQSYSISHRLTDCNDHPDKLQV